MSPSCWERYAARRTPTWPESLITTILGLWGWGGTSDHLHVLFRLSKNRALAEVGGEIKTSSSRWIKTQAKRLGGFHWQNGYGGFSGSARQLEQVVEYIDRQETHHRLFSFQDEARQFLKE